jgi:two-component system phosphate regulon sensor histidine kinase PhoR
VGIPKEYIGKVFDRLFRIPTGNVHDVKGFGLGLSYVKTVIERHGGLIYVESESDKGSTFVVKLKFDSNLK